MDAKTERLSAQEFSAYGAMRSVMPDHIYLPETSAQIYTSPCIDAQVTTPFDVLIPITACRKPIMLRVGESEAHGSALAASARERYLHARGVQLVIFQIGPFHRLYPSFRGLRQPLKLDRNKFTCFDGLLEAAYEGRLSLSGAQELFSGVMAVVARELPPIRPLDQRVQEAMKLVFEDPRLPLDHLATHCGLSYDRMSHLFIDQLGLSIRSFQVWVKLYRALTGVRYGQSLVELARIAGFSDAAHLSRVYKQVYGAPPSYFYYSGNVKLIASIAGIVPDKPVVGKSKTTFEELRPSP